MFCAKFSAPFAASGPVQNHSVQDQAISNHGITLFAAPAGYLLTDNLTMTIADHGLPLMWLRLGQEERDPATCLLSLIASARQLNSEIGFVTLEQMRRQPGPIKGWPPLFTTLACELANGLSESTVVVLEHIHQLNDQYPTLWLLGHYLLPGLSSHLTCILTSHHRVLAASLPSGTNQRGINDLRLDERSALVLAEQTEMSLSKKSICRAIDLTEGRIGALVGLSAACQSLGSTLVQFAVENSANADDLLKRIANIWLTVADTNSLHALALSLRLEYTHPDLLHATVGDCAPSTGPWTQQLTHGWARILSMWCAPLQAVLRPDIFPSPAMMRQAADYLAGQGAIEKSVSIYFELRDVKAASSIISEAANNFLDMGQWQTLEEWLVQLPKSVLYSQPGLVYAHGQIAMASGQTDIARHSFAVAADLFAAHHEPDGACLCLLADSAVAAWSGDNAHAQSQALNANLVADASGLNRYKIWANWQLGCLSARKGDLDSALINFDQAKAIALKVGDALVIERLMGGEALVRQWRDARRQRELCYQAYLEAEDVENKAAERMPKQIGFPPDEKGELLGAYGWSGLPLMLKMPGSDVQRVKPAIPDIFHAWENLIGQLRLHFHKQPLAQITEQIELAVPADDSLARVEQGVGFLPVNWPDIAQSHQSTGQSSNMLILTAHLLGTFRVTLNDYPIENWPKGKGQAVFIYLLTHRERPTPRDVLTETFWPEAEPDVARNRINVTLYGLRQALHSATDLPVVLFNDGSYCFSPNLQVWLDVEEFERHVQAGQRLDAQNQLIAAVAEYEVAASLYQGDFMADNPYEGWTVLTRERMRVTYLDILDRLSQIYFSQERYAACITLCNLIMSHDRCREDAHCRLMRCYSRQGQDHLALRQYQACVEALQEELDVSPAPATTQLFEQIRQHVRV